MFRTPSDYVAEAPEVVYHRVVLFYYLLGIAEPINGFVEMLWTLETPVAYISLPPFEVQLIVQLGTAVSFHRAGQSSIMKVFVLFTSDTFPGFNVFFKGILYINLSTIHPTVKTVGFLVDFHVTCYV